MSGVAKCLDRKKSELNFDTVMWVHCFYGKWKIAILNHKGIQILYYSVQTGRLCGVLLGTPTTGHPSTQVMRSSSITLYSDSYNQIIHPTTTQLTCQGPSSPCHTARHGRAATTAHHTPPLSRGLAQQRSYSLPENTTLLQDGAQG